MNFSENIRSIREGKKLSQADFAQELNITRQSVSKWETGKSFPDIDMLKKISRLYNISIDDLVRTNDTGSIQKEPPIIPNQDRKIYWRKNSSSDNLSYRDESLVLILLSVLSCRAPIIGILIPIFVLKINDSKNKYKSAIVLISIVCIFVNFSDTLEFFKRFYYSLSRT